VRRSRASRPEIGRLLEYGDAVGVACELGEHRHRPHCAGVGAGVRSDKSIVVASTTSTPDCGLGHILPKFKAWTGIDVKVVAQGMGQALDTR
jgi:hypothetical protein